MKEKLKTLTKSKRFWFSMIVFGVMIISFNITLIFVDNIEPVTLATGLIILGAPLYGYLIGETVRPSEKKSE